MVDTNDRGKQSRCNHAVKSGLFAHGVTVNEKKKVFFLNFCERESQLTFRAT